MNFDNYNVDLASVGSSEMPPIEAYIWAKGPIDQYTATDREIVWCELAVEEICE